MNNLKLLRTSRKFSQEEFAKIIGVAQNTISNWENGNRLIDAETMQKLADYFDVTVDYLLGRSSDTTSSPPPSGKGLWIPVLGKVQAGVPIEAIEDIIDYEEIDLETAAKGDYFALQIRGDSMEPKFSEGDVVIVKKQSDVETGDIAVVLVNGDAATVKKIKKRPEGLMLIPSNPAFEPMYYTNKEIANIPVEIIGKVIELRAKF